MKAKDIKLNKQNIKDKNIASLITLIIEIIKLISLFFVNIDLKIKFYVLLFSIVAISTTIIIYNKDRYSNLFGTIMLEFVSIIYFLSNIYGGYLIFNFLIKHEMTTTIKLFESYKKIKKLDIEKYYKWWIYLGVFILFWYCDYTLDFPNYIFSLIALFTSLLLFKKEIKLGYEHFKKYTKEIITLITKNILIFSLIGSIIGFSLIKITGGISTNEIVLANENTIIISLMAIFWAPIVEEIIFRGCLRKLIKKECIFIFVSCITFGLYHVIGYEQELIQYLYVILYSVLGLGLSLTYTKTNNIVACMIMHFIMNLCTVLF